MQELQKDPKAYSLDSLIFTIIDKAKRLDYKPTKAFLSIPNRENPSKRAYKNKKPWKKTKGTFCKNCKKQGHVELNC